MLNMPVMKIFHTQVVQVVLVCLCVAGSLRGAKIEVFLEIINICFYRLCNGSLIIGRFEK